MEPKPNTDFILVHNTTAYYIKRDQAPEGAELHELVQHSHRAAHVNQANTEIERMSVLAGNSDGWSLYA